MNERQRNTIATALTVIILGLGCILLLILGLSRPSPPPPEYGVEVNLGNSADGMGQIQPDHLTEQTSPPAPPPTSPSTPAPKNVSKIENVSTDRSDNITLKKQPKPKIVKPTVTPTQETKPQPKAQPQPKTQPQTQPQPKPEEPQLNPNALFPGRKPTQGGSEGTTGKPGDQGQPDGSKDGTVYSGTPGSGGISFSLAGRQSKSLVKPVYNSDDQGTVVVKIWVNADGAIIKAQAGEKGTTTNDSTLWRTAEAAALKSSFSANKNAPEQQVRTITYKFIKLN